MGKYFQLIKEIMVKDYKKFVIIPAVIGWVMLTVFGKMELWDYLFKVCGILIIYHILVYVIWDKK